MTQRFVRYDGFTLYIIKAALLTLFFFRSIFLNLILFGLDFIKGYDRQQLQLFLVLSMMQIMLLLLVYTSKMSTLIGRSSEWC
jgi:hypothetical protein